MTGVPHQKGSWTSYEAAEKFQDKEPTVRELVHRCLARDPLGLTDEELYKRLQSLRPGTLYATARARRIELVHQGFVEDSGFTRKSASGRKMVVWRFVIHPLPITSVGEEILQREEPS